MKRFGLNKESFATLIKRRKIPVIVFATVFASVALLLCSCLSDGKNGVDGKDGKDGRDGADATVVISENGEIIANGEYTGVNAYRADSEVVLGVEGGEYGKVVGGGKFASGETVAVKAIPNAGACFKGWKNQSGEIVSLDKTYAFVAEKGQTQLTAVFDENRVEVYFKISEYYCEAYFDDFSLEINGSACALKKVSAGYSDWFMTEAPLVFGYGERVTLKLCNFKAQTYSYRAYLSVLTEEQYNGASSSGAPSIDVSDTMEYSFDVTENKKYFFKFDAETDIFIEIRPEIKVTANDSTLGDVGITEYERLGDEVTLTAAAKDSGTTDYIYDFAGWYSGDKLVSENPTYSFTVNEYRYDFTAEFVKKYALKIVTALYEPSIIGENLDPTANKVTYKSVTIRAVNKKGEFGSVTFGGNYGGATPDGNVKICGYYEAGEVIFLSSEIESAHESYYVVDENDKSKEYKEKFVYNRWIVGNGNEGFLFGNGSSASYVIGESNGKANNLITVSLYVLHYGDKLSG